jgi:hypothetical protein
VYFWTDLQVKRNPHPHNKLFCQSTRRSEICVGVTQNWVCEKVIDWLKQDGTLGASELQRGLKDAHKIEVSYRRVYKGKSLAMDQLYGPWDKSF